MPLAYPSKELMFSIELDRDYVVLSGRGIILG
jgi:hypothetical protein